MLPNYNLEGIHRVAQGSENFHPRHPCCGNDSSQVGKTILFIEKEWQEERRVSPTLHRHHQATSFKKIINTK
jgi:hypothetical protein